MEAVFVLHGCGAVWIGWIHDLELIVKYTSITQVHTIKTEETLTAYRSVYFNRGQQLCVTVVCGEGSRDIPVDTYPDYVSIHPMHDYVDVVLTWLE